jgi:ankyrin repeat protein
LNRRRFGCYLASQLAAEPEFAQVSDPATEALDITPIHHAVAGGSVEALSVLLAHSQQPLKVGGRALRGAAERENLALVELLLERGADADDRRADVLSESSKGSSVGNLQARELHYAAKAGFLETIAVLLEHGADPSALDAQGCTPQEWLEQASKSVNLGAVRRFARSLNGEASRVLLTRRESAGQHASPFCVAYDVPNWISAALRSRV